MCFDTHVHIHVLMLWGLSKFSITVYTEKGEKKVTAKLEPCIQFQKEKKIVSKGEKRLKEIRVLPLLLLSPLFLYYKNELILRILSDYND